MTSGAGTLPPANVPTSTLAASSLPPLDVASASAVVVLANMVTDAELASTSEMLEVLVRDAIESLSVPASSPLNHVVFAGRHQDGVL